MTSTAPITEVQPKAVGSSTFDEHYHLLDTSGVAKAIDNSPIAEMVRKSNAELGRLGYSVYEDAEYIGHAFKKAGHFIVYFTPRNKNREPMIPPVGIAN
ncbi:hypothetical protein SUVZ_14G3540 [Saccharomyces uvarum]|uniref:Uncharacterized protein n=1 Tax=Saccharomyces uvarum TaxID=230603 RepID=A0AA35J6J1_SACUV|nr:hypothetical protein N7582_005000 [Saccharomyces uvarum]CAI4050672.1 hypothetical protein SUVC_14G3520 [Saccharomyces uvarum]CAI4052224.1 hypothetical protein SUVZ_14G3540 [Saccharomyces uvarum]